MKTLAKILGGLLLLLIVVVGYIATTQFSTSLSYQELSGYAYETAILPDGFNMNYRVVGNPDGETLLLVHGGGASMGDWGPWIDNLGERYKVITVDMPNHGLSDPLPADKVNTVEFSKKIESFVDTLGLNDFAIAGHSFGGETVLHYVTRNPARIKGLILVASGGYQPEMPEDGPERDLLELSESPLATRLMSYYGTRTGVAESLPTYFYDKSAITDDFVDRIFSLMRYEKNRGSMIHMIVNAAKDYKVVNGIQTIQIPTLVLWGDKDGVAVPEHGHRFDQDIPDSTLKMYPDIGHMIMQEATEQSLRDVNEFLEKQVFVSQPDAEQE